jgi:hypothetical protein
MGERTLRSAARAERAPKSIAGRRRSRSLATAGAAIATLVTLPAAAQSPVPARPDSAAGGIGGPVWLGSVAEDRLRDSQLLVGRSPDGFLLRSRSTLTDGPAAGRWPRSVDASLLFASNSAIPYTLNDGALWAGRGASTLLRVGSEARLGRVRIVLAPELAYSANRAFDFRVNEAPGRSPFASPWHVGARTIDLPSRFGDDAYVRVTPGQSSLSIDAGPVAVGLSTENSVWGPGRWSALSLSANAEGFPHAFVRTARPLRTIVGTVEARYLLGTLTPSTFVDTNVVARYRAFSGIAATLRPAGLPDLTLGVTRTVVAPLDDALGAATRALDPLLLWSSEPGEGGGAPRADQLTGAFARWVLPDDHAELYAEWARQATPASVRQFLAAPQEGAALTLGARALRPLGRGPLGSRYLRLEIELTNTEQSIAFTDRGRPAPFYTGRATREGYTHRGQLLGAGVGPGASAQWLATDHVTRSSAVGLFLGRVRWENDALYDQQNANFFRHDVSTLLGARGQARLRFADLHGEATWARRYNYLFQNGIANPGGRRTVDVTNLSLVFGVTAR